MAPLSYRLYPLYGQVTTPCFNIRSPTGRCRQRSYSASAQLQASQPECFDRDLRSIDRRPDRTSTMSSSRSSSPLSSLPSRTPTPPWFMQPTEYPTHFHHHADCDGSNCTCPNRPSVSFHHKSAPARIAQLKLDRLARPEEVSHVRGSRPDWSRTSPIRATSGSNDVQSPNTGGRRQTRSMHAVEEAEDEVASEMHAAAGAGSASDGDSEPPFRPGRRRLSQAQEGHGRSAIAEAEAHLPRSSLRHFLQPPSEADRNWETEFRRLEAAQAGGQSDDEDDDELQEALSSPSQERRWRMLEHWQQAQNSHRVEGAPPELTDDSSSPPRPGNYRRVQRLRQQQRRTNAEVEHSSSPPITWNHRRVQRLRELQAQHQQRQPRSHPAEDDDSSSDDSGPPISGNRRRAQRLRHQEQQHQQRRRRRQTLQEPSERSAESEVTPPAPEPYFHRRSLRQLEQQLHTREQQRQHRDRLLRDQLIPPTPPAQFLATPATSGTPIAATVGIAPQAPTSASPSGPVSRRYGTGGEADATPDDRAHREKRVLQGRVQNALRGYLQTEEEEMSS